MEVDNERLTLEISNLTVELANQKDLFKKGAGDLQKDLILKNKKVQEQE